MTQTETASIRILRAPTVYVVGRQLTSLATDLPRYQDNIEAKISGPLHLGNRARAAVAGNEHANTVASESVDRGRVKSVAFALAMGNVRLGVAAQIVQSFRESGSGGNPVDVEVAVNGHGLAILHRPA